MRFLIDAQLPPGLGTRPAERGHPAEHVNHIGMGAARDRSIWDYAAQAGAVLITKDEDFVVLAGREPKGPQIIWVRVGNIGNHALWRALDGLLDEIIDALDAGERIIEVV
jgi:predicted nuclease of predicted toxin-antitoxin system